MLPLLHSLALARRWTRTPLGWHAPHGHSPALLLDGEWRHLTLAGGGYVRVRSEAAALGWTVFVPDFGAVGRWVRFLGAVGLAALGRRG